MDTHIFSATGPTSSATRDFMHATGNLLIEVQGDDADEIVGIFVVESEDREKNRQFVERIGAKLEAMITRILGVILAALAVQFVLDGLERSLPGLAG